MSEFERLHNDYRAAKMAYDNAERCLAVARSALRAAEEARKREWDRLVQVASGLPEDVTAKVIEEQFSRHRSS